MSPIPAHCSELTKVVLAPVHPMLAAESAAGVVNLFSLRSSRPLLQMEHANDTSIEFSGDFLLTPMGKRSASPTSKCDWTYSPSCRPARWSRTLRSIP